MEAKGVAFFDTPIGGCGIAWGPRGITGVQLPGASEAHTRARLMRRFPDAREAPPPPGVAATVTAVVSLLNGEPAELTAGTLDMDRLPPFDRWVYAIAREIPPGETLTYGEVATRLGDPAAARAVGRALGDNPFPIIVPCHRVLGAGGKAGGFSAHGGLATKARLLSIERARTTGEPALFEDLPVTIRPDRR
ncbi:MAG: methylated-DNA--[protein]-cysteine S-methyltransferase [Caulobacteraceae bacterium]|nr:methylated-DNA--[protein]-cysteine S-methyltransferase [Caulobacteraceae bacterium]